MSEYAMRCEKPGIDFANEGGIVVDPAAITAGALQKHC